MVASTTSFILSRVPTGSPSIINSDHNFYIFRDGASNNNGGVSQYGSYGKDNSPGPGYVSYSSCQVESSGSVGSYGTVVGDSYGSFYQENFNIRSPYINLDINASCVESDGNVDVNRWDIYYSYGRKYFVTLRLPTQLETVYFILKLMEEVI